MCIHAGYLRVIKVLRCTLSSQKRNDKKVQRRTKRSAEEVPCLLLDATTGAGQAATDFPDTKSVLSLLVIQTADKITKVIVMLQDDASFERTKPKQLYAQPKKRQ